MSYIHVPVMARELVRFVDSSGHRGTGTLVDCTAGEGGHSELFLKTFPGLRVIALDRDGEILKIARGRLEQYAGRIDFINDNFSHISERLESMRSAIQYILFDFGISSFHFEASGRGFGFAKDERLDMRLDGAGEDAFDLVNDADEKTLADIIFRFGEERWARKIATAIVRARSEAPIETTGRLAGIVLGAIPKKFHVKNIHPATRVFQALRIAVNDELAAIGAGIAGAYDLLAPGGLIMAISFHSLEDRIVKEKFRRLSRGCFCEEDPRHCRCAGERAVNILTKKPLRPEIDEIENNARARSAKLRVCEKLPVPAAAGAAD